MYGFVSGLPIIPVIVVLMLDKSLYGTNEKW
jgi:hypothetical protein